MSDERVNLWADFAFYRPVLKLVHFMTFLEDRIELHKVAFHQLLSMITYQPIGEVANVLCITCRSM